MSLNKHFKSLSLTSSWKNKKNGSKKVEKTKTKKQSKIQEHYTTEGFQIQLLEKIVWATLPFVWLLDEAQFGVWTGALFILEKHLGVMFGMVTILM